MSRILILNTSREPRRLQSISRPQKTSKRATDLKVFQRKAKQDEIMIKKLEKQVTKYREAQRKIKMLTKWSIRSTQSSLKDVQDILETLEDLYGDEAFDDGDELRGE
jgi:hypothetical protein